MRACRIMVFSLSVQFLMISSLKYKISQFSSLSTIFCKGVLMIFFLQVCLKSYNVLLKRGARGDFFNSSYRLSVLVINKFIIVSENLFFNSMRNFSLFSTNQPVQQLRLPLFNIGKFYSVVFDEIVSIKFDLPEQVKWTLILSENTNVLLGPFIYNLNCEKLSSHFKS